MKKVLTKVMLVALVAILPLSIFAQKKKTVPVEKYFYISAEGGLSVNHTDLANYGGVAFYQNNQFTIDDYLLKNFDGKIGLGYQFSKVFGVNGKFGTATLGGEKPNDKVIGIDAASIPVAYANKGVNAKFENTTFMEGNLNLTINFANLFFGYNPRRVFNFIPHIGVGGIGFVAGQVTKLDDNSVYLAAKTKADREWALTVPVGAELNFNLARKLDFFIDYTFTWAGSDALDQVQKNPETYQVINDMYSSVNAGLRLKFNKKPCDIERMAAEADQIGMRTVPDPLEEKDGKVCFDVVFTVPGEYFEKDAVMNITPIMTYKGGQIALDPVTFVGENVKATQTDFQVNYKNGGEFTKHYCMDYVPEMESGKLIGNPMFYVYNGTIYPTQDEIVKNTYFTQGGDRTITEGVLVPVVKCEVGNVKTVVDGHNVVVTWVGEAESYDVYFGEGVATTATLAGVKGNKCTFSDVPAGDYNVYVKANCKDNNYSGWERGPVVTIIPDRTLVCTFYFDYNSSDLKGNAKMNKDAVRALAEVLASGQAINGFDIEGWASPEGELELNNDLANERAAAAAKAIKNQLKKMRLKESDFEVVAQGFGPDWDKFIELVQQSNINDKNQIVRVINNSNNREQEIKNMINVYPVLDQDNPDPAKKGVLPLLRRAEVYLK